MDLIEASVKRPIATSVIYTFICAAGFFVWGRIPQEVMPDLNFPQITVVTDYAQASPQEIENLITKPIEEAVGTVKNVKHIRSISKEGSSVVTVEFSWGTNMDFASLNVREKIDLVKSRLPQDIREPTVIKYNPFQAPILILSLQGTEGVDLGTLSHIAKQTMSNRLQKVDGVAAVEISGDQENEIQIDLSQNDLASKRVSLLEFNRGLAQANYRGAAGTAKEGSYDYSVRVFSSFDGVEDIRKAIISVDNPGERSAARDTRGSRDRERQRVVGGDQRLISVSHVGTVTEAPKERTSYSRYDGTPNITLQIQKQASASTINTVENVKKSLEDLKLLLPSDVTFTVIYDQGEIIKKGIGDVLGAVWGGGILAFITLFVFLKNWRDSLIVTFIIPTSTLATLIVMHLMGITLNTISLGGLALGVGMMGDAAVCVTENIHRRKNELGESLQDAVINGTREVMGAVTTSNLTQIAVFMPLLFVLGLIGQLFRDLSITVSISQLISIVVAMTLIPTLYILIGGGQGKTAADDVEQPKSLRSFEEIKDKYLGRLRWSLSSPRPVLSTVLVLFITAVLVLKLLPKQFLPNVDTDQLVSKLVMPNGTSLDKTNEIVMRIENQMRSVDVIEHVASTVGSSAKSAIKLLDRHEASMLIDLKKERDQSADQVAQTIREKLAEIKLEGGKVEISKAGGPLSFIQAQTAPIMAYLKCQDLAKLKAATAQLKEKLQAIKGVAEVRDSLAMPAPEIRLNVDKERAARLGLTVSDIGQTVMAAYHGREVTQIHKEGREIPILVRLRKEDRTSIGQLRSVLIPTSAGGTIPLSDVADLSMGEGPFQIDRIDQERFVLVQGETSKEYGSSSRAEVEKIFKEFNKPQVTLELAGEKKAQRESFVSMIFTILVSILLVYMIMAVQFESLMQPLLILFTIPLSVIGMAAGLFITGKSMSVIAGMGLLLLGGIVVNNGIVLIDFMNNERDKDMSLSEALVEACRTRLRPIFMTACSTVVGLLPLALGIGEGAELQAPMAITVIFGLIGSTFLTLIALPTLYYAIAKRKGSL